MDRQEILLAHTYEEVPDRNESSRLTALFNSGRYTELEALARTITRKYPKHGVAWKLLGASLFIAGSNEDALVPLRKATELLPNDLDSHNIIASVLHGLGRFAEAELSFRRVLQIDPDFAEAHNNLGVLRNGLGKFTDAEASLRHALQLKPDFAEAYNNLGNVLKELGRKTEAVDCYRLAIQINPDFSDAYDNLGTALMGLGRSVEAEACYRRAIEITPDSSDVYNNLGVLLKSLGRLAEAEACYLKAVDIEPGFAEAHNNRGIVLKELGRVGEAEASYRRALCLKPDFSDAYNNLGIALKDLGLLEEAEGSYRRALELKPGVVEVSTNLAALLNGQGKFSMAFNVIWPVLQVKETTEAKRIFVDCVKRNNLASASDDIRAAIARALIEPWGRPGDLALVGTHLVMNTPDVCECAERANKAWPLRLSEQDLYGENTLAGLAEEPLLCGLLRSTPICTITMERFLTVARCAMLESVSSRLTASDGEYPKVSGFYCALAQQCFVNEYVFFHTEDEIRKAHTLRETLIASLETTSQVPVDLLIVVASYFPLCSLPGATRLFEAETEWPETVLAVLDQQISEPAEEMLLRTSISRLTDIDNETSLLVRNQYEENPYPRWIKAEPPGKPMAVAEYLRRRFPLASFQRNGNSDSINILIAGCGTGQHPIGTAQKFEGAQVLAIDLSISSLCYAKRKTRELGLTTIFYAQADVLKLGSLGGNFDAIESCGVLHHLADPFAGWRILLSLLRPGGFMNLGFYSELARRNLVKARDIISRRGYGTTADEIRRCRQELVDSFSGEEFQQTLGSIDFFSISTCRDLLFHVQEKCMNLAVIDTFLCENNLTFLGFEMDDNTLNAYKRRFPDDQAAANLSQWHVFESENPDTFCSMYQFWIQKAE